MSRRDSREFMRDLVADRPRVRPSYEEHLKDYDGNLLPHMLIADIFRWAIAEQDTQSLHVLQLPSWRKVHFADMPDAKDDVDNAIEVSFIEHLPLPWEPEACSCPWTKDESAVRKVLLVQDAHGAPAPYSLNLPPGTSMTGLNFGE